LIIKRQRAAHLDVRNLDSKVEIRIGGLLILDTHKELGAGEGDDALVRSV
jgi:hypothetical protein